MTPVLVRAGGAAAGKTARPEKRNVLATHPYYGKRHCQKCWEAWREPDREAAQAAAQAAARTRYGASEKGRKRLRQYQEVFRERARRSEMLRWVGHAKLTLTWSPGSGSVRT